MPYPYPRLSVVEVPFLVQWYYEGWKENGGLVEPGVLMVEEDVLMQQRFQRTFQNMQRRSRGNDDPRRMKRDLLVGAVFRTFVGREEGRAGLFRSPVVQLWSFDKAFRGENRALLERGMPLYLQEDVGNRLQEAFYAQRGRMGFAFGRQVPSGRTPWDSLVVQMQQRPLAAIDPDAEPEFYRAVLDAKGPALFKAMQAVLGDEAFRNATSAFGEGRRYGEVRFADFEQAAAPDSAKASSGGNLRRIVRDWIYGTSVPGYTLTRVRAYKVDDGWGSVAYQVIVRVRNGEPGRGFVQVRAMGREDEAFKNVEIEGGQEVEVALMASERPFRVTVEPFFAKNRRPLASPLRVPEEPQKGVPQSYVREVTEQEATFSEIVVDNEDEGFSMPNRRAQRYLRPGLKGDNWSEFGMPMAYGKYEQNFRFKRGGDGAQPAVWTARLPRDGLYDVAYYFPSPEYWKRFAGARMFVLVVLHGGEADTLTLDRDELKGGWNTLGRFQFQADEEASVELSDRARGRVYADAVRWRYFDPDNPDQAYEEDIPGWDFPGQFDRGGRGRGGGGGPPGGGPGGRPGGGPGGPPGGM